MSSDLAGECRTKRSRKLPPKDTEEYRQRRERNNEAVKKSRQLTKTKAVETFSRVDQLKSKNENLEGELDTLSKELSLLKDLFKSVNHIKHNVCTNNSNLDSTDRNANEHNQMSNLTFCEIDEKNIIELNPEFDFENAVSDHQKDNLNTIYQCISPKIEKEVEIECSEALSLNSMSNCYEHIEYDAIKKDHNYSLINSPSMSVIYGLPT